MTTICWDGRTLAADKRATQSHGRITMTTKVFRLGPDEIAAGSGEAPAIREFIDWYIKGANVEAFPPHLRDSTRNGCYVLVVERDGGLRTYENSPIAFVLDQKRHAMGSGGDYAIMAMRCGKSAAQAIELTAEFDCYTGNGVDTLTFDV